MRAELYRRYIQYDSIPDTCKNVEDEKLCIWNRFHMKRQVAYKKAIGDFVADHYMIT